MISPRSLLALSLLAGLSLHPLAAAEPTAPTASAAESAQAWEALSKVPLSTPQPPEWQTQRPSEAEHIAWIEAEVPRLIKAADQAADFTRRFPTSEHVGAARELEFQLINRAALFGHPASIVRRDALLEAKLKDLTLPVGYRQRLRTQQIMMRVRDAVESAPDEAIRAQEEGGRTLLKEFPNDPDTAYSLLLGAANGLDEKKSRAIATEVAASNAAADLKARARGLLRRFDAVGKPLDLRFTAVDGREVDLRLFKGKVVLIDFWATWCPPCVAEMPNLKLAYQALRGRGFEIIGISADSEREALQSFVAEQKIPWPHFFDGQGPSNRISAEYAVSQFPTMWLVDKQGRLRDLDVRSDFVDKVLALLAE